MIRPHQVCKFPFINNQPINFLCKLHAAKNKSIFFSCKIEKAATVFGGAVNPS